MAVNSSNSQSFSYDNLQRLTQATGGYGSFGFTYDKDGNRLSQTLGAATTNYGYRAASDLLATLSVGGVQTQQIGYTADGRMASFSPGIQAPGGQYITSLSYNQDGQLSAVNAAGGALASYTYDAFGQRLIKTISGANGEIYQYGQNGMLLEETNSSGVAPTDYIYLDGRPVATLNPSTGAVYYLQDDMLGTPQLATDSSQAVAWQATYEPFGTASVSGTITQNLRFPGQYFDVESGWNHNGFRNYLPNLGRYAEPDPLATQGTARFYDSLSGHFLRQGILAGGINSYAYVDDDPMDLVDPIGLAPLTPAQGQALARIAATWTGTQYKWGGHTTQGADCSGSTWAIYAQAGFKYSATPIDTHSFKILVKPTPTPRYFFPVVNPQPGDVMLWPGHMAIFDPQAQQTARQTCNCSAQKGANMFSATHQGGKPYGGYDSEFWFRGKAPSYYRYDTLAK